MLMQKYMEKKEAKRRKSGGRKPGVKTKNRADLREMINKELRARHLLDHHDEFDAVAMMAVIAQKAFNSEDYHLALVAAREVAKYTWAPLQAKKAEDDDNKDTTKPDMSDIADKFFRLSRAVPPMIEDKNKEDRVLDLIPSSSEVVEVQ